MELEKETEDFLESLNIEEKERKIAQISELLTDYIEAEAQCSGFDDTDILETMDHAEYHINDILKDVIDGNPLLELLELEKGDESEDDYYEDESDDYWTEEELKGAPCPL